MYCGECGSETKDSWRYCRDCGMALGTHNRDVETASVERQGPDRLNDAESAGPRFAATGVESPGAAPDDPSDGGAGGQVLAGSALAQLGTRRGLVVIGLGLALVVVAGGALAIAKSGGSGVPTVQDTFSTPAMSAHEICVRHMAAVVEDLTAGSGGATRQQIINGASDPFFLDGMTIMIQFKNNLALVGKTRATDIATDDISAWCRNRNDPSRPGVDDDGLPLDVSLRYGNAPAPAVPQRPAYGGLVCPNGGTPVSDQGGNWVCPASDGLPFG